MEYTTADVGDGFTIESSTANADQLREAFTNDPAPEPAKEEATDAPTAESARPEGTDEAAEPEAEPKERLRDEKGRFTVAEGHDPTKKPSKKDRIGQLVWEREEAKRLANEEVTRERSERERLARELDEARRQAQPPPAQPATPSPAPSYQYQPPADDPEPTLEQFANEADPYLSLIKAQAKWEARQEFRAEQQRRALQEAQEADRRAIEAHISRTKSFAETVPDYHEVTNSALQISASMQRAIVGSELGPAIAYYLAKHPGECEELTAQTAHLGPEGVALTKRLLEALVSPHAVAPAARPVAVVSTAKPPIRPVGSSPVTSPPDEAELEFDEFKRRRDAADIKRRRG